MAKDKWRQSGRYVDFTGASRAAQAAAVATAAVPAEKPTVSGLRDTQQNLPPVPRPDVPETTEQASPNAMDSALGWLADKADNFVPDDLGGIARGTSGWLAAVPGYQQTMGQVASVGLTGGSALMDAMYWGSEQADHVGAMVFSAMPGGMDTVGWDKAHEVSAMQAAATSTVGNESIFGLILNRALDEIVANSRDPEAAQAIRDEWQGEGGFFNVTNPKNDLNDKATRDKAMSTGAGMLTSGVGDVLYDVLADPTILGGKFSAAVRFGTKAGKMAGLSNQSLATAERVRGFGSRIDDAVQYVTTKGAEGSWTAEGEHVRDLISGRNIANNVFMRNSANPKLLGELAAQVAPDDFATGAALVKAAAGDSAGWRSLRERNVRLYDQLSNSVGVDPLDLLPGKAELTADQLSYGQRLVDEAVAVAQDVAPAESRAAGQLITRGGSRSKTMAKAADAWRRGAAANQFGKVTPIVTDEPPLFGKPGWGVTTIEAVAGSRPVRIMRWLGQASPNGIVHLKGGDGATALTEVQAYLRKSPMSADTATRLYDDFVRASTPESKRLALQAIEQADVEAIAARHGVSPAVAKAMYESYAMERKRHLVTLRKPKNGFAVDEEGGLVTTPGLYTELDEAFPMLDQAVMNKVIGKNATWLRTVEDVVVVMDTVNKWWKLSVLIRGGYPQRNVAEGAMRSLAAQGLAAMNPKALTRLPSNAYYYAGSRALRRTAAHQEKSLLKAHESLTEARDTLLQTRKEARVDAMLKNREKAAGLTPSIKKLQSRKTLTAAQKRELERLTDRRQKFLDEAERIKREYVDPATPELTRLGRNEALLLNQIDSLSQEILDTASRMRAKDAKRVKAGRAANVMDDGTRMPGAFQGAEGDIARLLSSADRTAHMTFDASFESRRAAQELSEHYSVLDPVKIQPDQVQLYWDEYAIRLNQRYRSDALIMSWIRQDARVTGNTGGTVLERTKQWLMSPAGKSYRDSVSVNGRKLSTGDGRPREAAIEEYLTETWMRYNREIPRETGLRAMIAEGPVTPSEVAAAFGPNVPPAIPVRLFGKNDAAESLWAKGRRFANTSTDAIMRGIGSFPETVLLRHPFYDSVYRAEQTRLWRLAADQGQDMASPSVKVRINKASHAAALKATRSTLYTIENVSNTANALRWVVPFFPAFENALRTWGRLAYQKPQILGYGALLWNVPNNLGIVYDKDGNKVDRSNMFKDEGNVIVWPQEVQDFLIEHAPPGLNPGGYMRQRQSGYNVIFPGNEWWWPGVGPMALTSTALALRGKPEIVDVLRANLSENMLNGVIPNGDPNTDLTDVWLSTTLRRIKDGLAGTSENGAYLTLVNTIIEDTYIDAQVAERKVTKADVKRAYEKADEFWKFSIRAAAMDFTPSSYQSPYVKERAYWVQLLDDQSLSYEAKLTAFKTKYPDMMAVTRSGTESKTGLNPTLSAYRKVVDNPSVVQELNDIDPELVGMFGNLGTHDDPFSYSVYGEFKNMAIDKSGKPIKDQLTPEQILRNNETRDGWDKHNEMKSTFEDQARLAGFKSLQVKGAEPWAALLDEADAEIAARYPAWAQEKETYTEKWPKFVAGARILVDNADAVGESGTIDALSEYLRIRDWVASEKAGVKDDELKATLVGLAYEEIAKLRDSDIGFADLYDRYLVKDDFRELP